MALLHRVESALGAATLAAVRRQIQRRLGVRIREHHDERGRITPYLEVGRPVDGTLVWLHGFSDRFDTILQAAPHLIDRWRIVSLSVPAFGEGWVDPSETHTFGAYTAWLQRVIEDEVEGPFHLMGNSLGGAIALSLAARLPRLRSVVALNAAGVRLEGVPCAHGEMEGGDNMFEIRSRDDYAELQSRVFHQTPSLPRWVVAHLFDEQRRNADWYVRVGKDLSTSEVRAEGEGWLSYVDLPDIAVPTLALWGDRDTFFPTAHAEHIASTVPRGEVEWLEAVGHAPHLESPRRLAEAFARWAERVP